MKPKHVTKSMYYWLYIDVVFDWIKYFMSIEEHNGMVPNKTLLS